MTTVASRVELDITPLTGFTGAEIRGVDLHRTLTESTVADILAALVEYKVIFFPGQHLSSEEHLAFATQCGEITEAHPISRGNHGHPGLHEINYSEVRDAYATRRDPLKKPRLDGWHTDVTPAVAPKLDVFPFPAAVAPDIEYPIAALKGAPNAKGAQAFVDYITSPEGQQFLKARGFISP